MQVRFGGRHATGYDADGRTLTTVVDAGTGNLALTSTVTYDQLGNELTSTDPAGRMSATYYDSAGRVAGSRAPIAPTGTPAPLCPGSTTLYCNSLATFDILGRTISTKDAAGHVSSAKYDLNGNPVSSTDALGSTTSARYDIAGRRVSVTDALGNVTTTAYDALNRPTIVTRPDGTFAKTVYDAASQATDGAAPAAAGTPDANLNWAHRTFDPAGRVISTTVHYVAGGANTADQNVVSSAVTFDAEGHALTTTTAPGSVGGAGIVTKATYDTLGRRTSAIVNYVAGGPVDDQTNMTTTYAYDALGRLIAQTDPAGVVTSSSYDRAARLSAVTMNYVAGQPSTAGQNVTSLYGYNGAGELTSYCPPVTVATGGCTTGAWRYGRDGLGNVATQDAPAGSGLGQLSATYDPVGRLAASFDGLHAQTYAYDAANEVSAITATGGGAPTISTTYTYDALGRRTSASNGADTLTFSYDPLNRLSVISRAEATISGATYNPDDTLATSIEPAGTASFTYDGLARLASAAMPALFAGNATFSWRPDGLLGSRAWPSGTTESFSYDAAKRPSGLTLASAAGTTLATFATSFDRVGNLVAESQSIPGRAGLAAASTLSLVNDPLRRLTSYTLSAPSSSPSTVAYSYDADSNRLSAGATAFTYNGADQLVAQTKAGATRGFAYDAAGNQTGSPVGASEWPSRRPRKAPRWLRRPRQVSRRRRRVPSPQKGQAMRQSSSATTWKGE